MLSWQHAIHAAGKEPDASISEFYSNPLSYHGGIDECASSVVMVGNRYGDLPFLSLNGCLKIEDLLLGRAEIQGAGTREGDEGT